MNKKILLNSRPNGVPKLQNFKLIKDDLPEIPSELIEKVEDVYMNYYNIFVMDQIKNNNIDISLFSDFSVQKTMPTSLNWGLAVDWGSPKTRVSLFFGGKGPFGPLFAFFPLWRACGAPFILKFFLWRACGAPFFSLARRRCAISSFFFAF